MYGIVSGGIVIYIISYKAICIEAVQSIAVYEAIEQNIMRRYVHSKHALNLNHEDIMQAK